MMNGDSIDMSIDGNTGLEGTKWWSPDGTDHFVVRDVLITPEGFTIRTDDGRMLSGDIMEKYIQSDTPVSDMNHRPEATMNPHLLEGIDDSAIVDDTKKPTKGGSFGSLKYTHAGVTLQEPRQQHRMVRKEPDPLNDPLVEESEQIDELDEISFGMIDRVLGKLDMNKLVRISIDPNDKVDNGIEVLVDTLNINRHEISTYLSNSIEVRIHELLHDALIKYLDRILGPEMVLAEAKTEDITADV